jgi:hypothetical protein
MNRVNIDRITNDPTHKHYAYQGKRRERRMLVMVIAFAALGIIALIAAFTNGGRP